MYTRQEASQLRSRFWTVFGQYLRPVKGAGGETVNWINYKTGVKDLFFRLDADQKRASVTVEFRQQFPEERYRLFDKWASLREMMRREVPGTWQWERDVTDEDGRIISRIRTTSGALNLFTENDWPAIISFLKTHMVALDAFWDLVKEDFT
jgi:hypothetical protein